MQVLIRAMKALAVIAVVLVAVAYLLPREVVVARSTTIDAPPQLIFPHLNDFHKMNKWSPWAKIDPQIKWEFSGPATGVGAKVSWTSNHEHVGSGSNTITESVENQHVKTALDFGDHGTAKATLKLVPEGASTKITWGFTTDTGYNPIARYMGLMMDTWVGDKYAEGLADLKTMVEAQPAPEAQQPSTPPPSTP